VDKLEGLRGGELLCQAVSGRQASRTGQLDSSLVRDSASGANRVGRRGGLPLPHCRRGLGLPWGEQLLASVVMQLHQEEELELCQNGRSDHGST